MRWSLRKRKGPNAPENAPLNQDKSVKLLEINKTYKNPKTIGIIPVHWTTVSLHSCHEKHCIKPDGRQAFKRIKVSLTNPKMFPDP